MMGQHQGRSIMSQDVEVKRFTERSPDTSASQAKPQAEEAVIVIFGASGDLTARKLIPALYRLWTEGFLSDRAPIVGVARREKSDDQFRAEMAVAVKEEAPPGSFTDQKWRDFARRLSYHRTDIQDPNEFASLKKDLEAIEERSGVHEKQIAYLATTPDLFVPAVEAMGKS